jgi:mannose-6-phosphate isomerase-like protein (cupin superfamily)
VQLRADDLINDISVAFPSLVQKPWGHEIMVEANGFIIKVIHVNSGCRTSLQHHEVKREVSVVLDGGGGIFNDEHHRLDDNKRPSTPVFIKPGMIHRTVGPCTLLEVTSLENWDVVRHADDYGREGEEERM